MIKLNIDGLEESLFQMKGFAKTYDDVDDNLDLSIDTIFLPKPPFKFLQSRLLQSGPHVVGVMEIHLPKKTHAKLPELCKMTVLESMALDYGPYSLDVSPLSAYFIRKGAREFVVYKDKSSYTFAFGTHGARSCQVSDSERVKSCVSTLAGMAEYFLNDVAKVMKYKGDPTPYNLVYTQE